MNLYNDIFTIEKLTELFPEHITNDFFEALFGDAEEGSYDIELSYLEGTESNLIFELNLLQREGCCLACNLTYGLPQVFSRHPIINVNGLAEKIANEIGKTNPKWELGTTIQKSNTLHSIPLTITF